MDRKPPHEVYEVVKREGGGRGVVARLFQIFLFHQRQSISRLPSSRTTLYSSTSKPLYLENES